jgi:hypothetical protein
MDHDDFCKHMLALADAARSREVHVLLDESQFNPLLAALQAIGVTQPPVGKPNLTFSITTPCGVKITGVPPLMSQITDIQSLVYSIGAKDSAGNPVVVKGPLTADVSDPTVLSAVVNADGTITVKALGPLSTPAGVQLTVDDTGDGGLTGTDNVVVVASAPTTLVLTPGTPA